MLLINHYGLNVRDPRAREFLVTNLSARSCFAEGEDQAEIDTSQRRKRQLVRRRPGKRASPGALKAASLRPQPTTRFSIRSGTWIVFRMDPSADVSLHGLVRQCRNCRRLFARAPFQ